jgi:BRCT domain type II-containing protein
VHLWFTHIKTLPAVAAATTTTTTAAATTTTTAAATTTTTTTNMALQRVLAHGLSFASVSRQLSYYKVILINSLQLCNHRKLNYS